MPSRKVTIGEFRLPGVFNENEQDGEIAVLLFHPHPAYGGAMDDPVVLFLEQTFQSIGLSTLRFAFRGSMQSFHDYAGVEGGIQDALAAVDFLKEQSVIKRIGISGYSFGGSVAFNVAGYVKPEFIVTYSTSLNLIREVAGYERNLMNIKCPVLMFHGHEDRNVPAEDMQTIKTKLGSDTIHTISLTGVNHFYLRGLEDTRLVLISFLSPLLDT